MKKRDSQALIILRQAWMDLYQEHSSLICAIWMRSQHLEWKHSPYMKQNQAIIFRSHCNKKWIYLFCVNSESLMHLWKAGLYILKNLLTNKIFTLQILINWATCKTSCCVQYA